MSEILCYTEEKVIQNLRELGSWRRFIILICSLTLPISHKKAQKYFFHQSIRNASMKEEDQCYRSGCLPTKIMFSLPYCRVTLESGSAHLELACHSPFAGRQDDTTNFNIGI